MRPPRQIKVGRAGARLMMMRINQCAAAFKGESPALALRSRAPTGSLSGARGGNRTQSRPPPLRMATPVSARLMMMRINQCAAAFKGESPALALRSRAPTGSLSGARGGNRTQSRPPPLRMATPVSARLMMMRINQCAAAFKGESPALALRSRAPTGSLSGARGGNRTQSRPPPLRMATPVSARLMMMRINQCAAAFKGESPALALRSRAPTGSLSGARGGNRTRTRFLETDFKSAASTDSATRASVRDFENLEARPGIEPRSAALQAAA